MNNLDEILKNIKLEDISSEGTGFSELPDGYYLCEVEEVKFAISKTTGNDMELLLMMNLINNIYKVQKIEKFSCLVH